MDKIAGARMTIEQQVMTLEGANVSLEAMNAMKMGAASMRSIHNDMYPFNFFYYYYYYSNMMKEV